MPKCTRRGTKTIEKDGTIQVEFGEIYVARKNGGQMKITSGTKVYDGDILYWADDCEYTLTEDSEEQKGKNHS